MRIYTDASTHGNVSGVAFVVTDARDKEIYKAGIVIEQSDNNTAELCAVLIALENVQYVKTKHVTIFTDSQYVINAMRTGSCRSIEKPIVQKIKKLMDKVNSSLMWIKGHYRNGTAPSYFNKRADKLAKVVRKQYEKRIRAEKKALMQKIRKEKLAFHIINPKDR